MAHREEFLRTIGYGEAAVAQLRRNENAAYPRNYELWYNYCAGFNHALNRAVNDILRSKGRIDKAELLAIYNQFISPSRLSDRIEDVGGRISGEIEGVMTVMNKTIAASTNYAGTLSEASTELSAEPDPSRLRGIVGDLLVATRATEKVNRELEGQLADSQRQISELKESLESLRFETLTDELTTLANRKHFDQSLERAVANAVETDGILSLLITDIDNFKSFNDSFGHQTGDQVLRLVALSVKQAIKGHHLACRYGGEEFAIILPKTSLSRAEALAERIRESVKEKELKKRSTGETLGFVTVSVGVATYHAGDTAISLIERADTALYLAKRAGRNRVCTEAMLATSAGEEA
ncbi:GGDEF domain-containing protein [Pleomorphomonas sp. JP5]|uniref:GGDEF domain-containing protein n=1 Tax=Pleomorphomonas sp. JP5 TaxID=2942998 RepID=UPI002043DC6E|nr:GGDEF domain-containing protein [Pleomorphomonas sp. JP5]MCM5559011.1 GGDEF domain-containing protein [Pleomorphomonas sp. JP5]